MPETAIPWQPNKLEASYFKDVNHLFRLNQYKHWPKLSELNSWSRLPYQFVSQQQLAAAHNYEHYIATHSAIPTRSESWHDLFNAVIWHLFPRTKRLFNQWHVEDIARHGEHPRSKRRNKITQFDECGVVIVHTQSAIPSALLAHDWQQAFVAQQQQWHQNVRVFVFGHAIYEMLLDPFIGLTAKWLSIDVAAGFWQQSLMQQYRDIDQLLARKFSQQRLFSQCHKLAPIPLLGIPGWLADQSPGLYANADYFRAKRHTSPYLTLASSQVHS